MTTLGLSPGCLGSKPLSVRYLDDLELSISEAGFPCRASKHRTDDFRLLGGTDTLRGGGPLCCSLLPPAGPAAVKMELVLDERTTQCP